MSDEKPHKRLNTHTKKILQLKKADDTLRQILLEEGVLFDGYHPRMEELHLKNAEALGAIMDQIGYPTPAKVGQEASDAAWLIIQHAISKPEFMRACAVLLEKAVQQGQVAPTTWAYLTDRIAVLEGRLQLFGTQFDWDVHLELNPLPYDDLEAVNKRRADIGLNTLEAQTMLMRERAKAEQNNPPNMATRNATYEAWRKRVGWAEAQIR